MVVVASANGQVGIRQAMAVLEKGGSALDAVETGIIKVEENPADHTVGYSGLLNMIGEVELDASIMDGKPLAAGAVGALQHFLPAISVARKIMEELPHVFLVEAGAERFASEMGFQRQELLTSEAKKVWEERLKTTIPSDEEGLLRFQEKIRQWVHLAADPERPQGTVNFIARDKAGNLCAGVSTSGWAWKYPGRLGDSPVIGAGNYADNRYGATPCTGRGEMAIRTATARSIVLYLKMGMPLQEAVTEAMREVEELIDPYRAALNVLAMDREGNHLAMSNRPGAQYVYMGAGMSDPCLADRQYFMLENKKRRT